MPVELGRLDQAGDGGGTLTGHEGSGEQPVLSSGRPGSDLLLVVVVVDRQCRVVEVARERGPAFEAVVDRLGGGRAVGDAGALADQPVVQGEVLDLL